MASQIIHALEGWQAFSRSMPEVCAQLDTNLQTWFFLGCQGPDIFYHGQRTAPYGIYYGGLLHRSKFGLFARHLLEAVCSFPLTSPEMLFALGFASHGWIDAITHPYVIYHAGWYDPRKPETRTLKHAHTFLERILDTLYWEEQTHSSITAYTQSALFIPGSLLSLSGYEEASSATDNKDYEHLAAIIHALMNAFSSTYHDRFLKFSEPERRIANAFFDAFHVFMKSDPSRIKVLSASQKATPLPNTGKAMLFPPCPSKEIDWQNLAHTVWYSPCDAEHAYTASWKDLLLEAQHNNIAMFQGIYSWYQEIHSSGQNITSMLGELHPLELHHEAKATVPVKDAASKQFSSKTHENTAKHGLAPGLFPSGTLNVGDAAGSQKTPHLSRPLPVYAELERFSLENY